MDIKRRFSSANCLVNNNYDIFCLSKTWLVDEVPNDALFLNNYKVIHSDRNSREEKTKHGGVLIGIRKNGFSFLVVDSKQDECVFIIIETKNFSFILCCLYNAPKESKNRWSILCFQKLCRYLQKKQTDQKCDFTMITGDINFSNTDWKTMHSEDNHQSNILGLLFENSFEQIMESVNKTKLDVMLTNDPPKIVFSRLDLSLQDKLIINGNCFSGHLPFRTRLNSCFSNEMQKPTIYCPFNKNNWKEMIQKLKAEPFYPYCPTNVDKIVEQWYDWLNPFMETNFPRLTKHRTQLPPWITPPTSLILKKLNTAKKQTSQKREKIENFESEYKTSAEIDLATFGESIFASRKFSELNKYFNLRKSEFLPGRLYFGDKIAESEV